jgi:hypothetical protein
MSPPSSISQARNQHEAINSSFMLVSYFTYSSALNIELNTLLETRGIVGNGVFLADITYIHTHMRMCTHTHIKRTLVKSTVTWFPELAGSKIWS